MAMLTSFEEIYRIFLNSISNDYRLKKMFEDAPEVAEDMLQTWLIKAIAGFRDCKTDLSTTIDFDEKTFGVKLSLDESVILANLMLLSWMEYNINNIVQMDLSIQDRDFKTHAEERNLSGKVEYRDKMREIIAHDISEYTKKLYPISSWASGGK